MKRLSRFASMLAVSVTALLTFASADVAAQSSRALDVRSARVAEHWTPERRAAAIPRDLVIDERGLGYLRGHGNSLTPYGHNIQAQAAPGGSKDTTGPTISGLSPAAGATIGASASFSATVSDASGVRTVTFHIRQGTGQTQSFNGTQGAGGVWSVNLSGFTNGSWSYYVSAKDGAKPANTSTSVTVPFTVSTSTGGGGGGGAGTIVNSQWTGGGVVQRAVGRIYFEMPGNSRRTTWSGYVCSGTVANDATSGRSIIITAAHCVYDDAYKAFARNVLFIPDQDSTTGTGTDLNCANDPIGCWAPDFGVVDVNWTTRSFPDNVAWDYAYYVVNDSGAHSGNASASSALDGSVTAMDVSFAAPGIGPVTHALGYSYSEDPQFMYCSDPMQALDAVNYWLPNCGLSGGSSGGPWSQPFNVSTGNGPIISVNSWGYTNQPGMAGPKLAGTSAACVFAAAKTSPLGLTYADGDAGVAKSCP
jgi:hypothetical protein